MFGLVCFALFAPSLALAAPAWSPSDMGYYCTPYASEVGVNAFVSFTGDDCVYILKGGTVSSGTGTKFGLPYIGTVGSSTSFDGHSLGSSCTDGVCERAQTDNWDGQGIANGQPIFVLIHSSGGNCTGKFPAFYTFIQSGGSEPCTEYGIYPMVWAPLWHNVSSNITSNTTWLSGHTYKVSGNVSVSSGVTLTVQPGSVVKFDTATSSSLIVDGTLSAIGTATSTIYFTSLKDDSAGGDTNLDSASTTPAAGDWGRIQVSSSGIANIAYVTIGYGGTGSQGMIRNNGGSLLISNSRVATSSSYGIFSDSSGATTTIQASEITNSTHGFYSSNGASLIHASSTVHNNTHGFYLIGGDTRIAYNRIFDNSNFGVYVNDAVVRIDVSDIYDNTDGVHVAGGTANNIKITSSHLFENSYGIYVNDGLMSVAGSVIENNSNQGIFNTGSGGTITATYNYWGAADGPGGAGPGSGDEVTADVDYDPFLTQAHYVQTDESGNLLSSVGGGNEIDWAGGPFYPEAWYPALETWNTLGGVAFATDTPLTIQDLEIASTTADDLSWAGLWNSNPSPDTLTVNAYYMDTYSLDEKKNVFAHELGHAVGLGHSYLGNMMHYTITGTTTLGIQDISDYNYLWP